MKSKTLQEQINKFYGETGYKLEIKDGRAYYKDSLDLRITNVTKLPDNLVVGKHLDLSNTKITELPNNLIVGGYLDLSRTNITKLPDNLLVGGSLYLSESKITELPNNLVVGNNLYDPRITKLPDNLVVGGYLDLASSKIKKLPENFVVGGYLDLRYTKITELPENLVVGDSLDLRHTMITKLPESLIVGNILNLYSTKITKLPNDLIVGGAAIGMIYQPIFPTLTQEGKKKLQKIKSFLQWNAGGKIYIKVDGIFSVVDSHRGNVWITHRIGKNETLYVITDGNGHYAHGNTLKEAKADLIYKINNRDASIYKNLSLNDEVSFEEAIAMYRTVTGACVAGTRDFIKNRLPEPHKEKYTIREVIKLTNGEYGSETFKNFFDKKK